MTTQTILTLVITTAITVAVTILVTALVNHFLNRPKERKKREEEERQIREQRQTEVKALTVNLQTLKDCLEQFKQEDEAHIKALTDLNSSIAILKSGMQDILKHDLKNRYDYWLDRGYASADIKEDIEHTYNIYHNLGANGVMNASRKKFLNLPNKLSKQNTKKGDKE